MRRVATLGELDLSAVLGLAVSSEVGAALVAVDARLDRLERGRPRNGWWVAGERDLAPGPNPSGVLDRTLSYPARADDLLELAVNVWRRDLETLLVDATVEVNCFCPTNHNVHVTAEQEWTASTDAEVRDALAAAVTALEGWAELGADADRWRAVAGLPARPGAP